MNVPLVQGTGVNRRKLKKCNFRGSKCSSTAGNNRGRAGRIVAFCPFDVGENMANPEQDIHISPSPTTKFGVCKRGHRFPVGGHSIAGGFLGQFSRPVSV